MPLQNFVDGGLPTIKAAWLNALDVFYTTLFNSSTTAAQARTALSVYSSAAVDSLVANYLPLAGGNMTGGINDTMATVASATSTTAAQIWTPGSMINFTGTAQITGFANAPVAGSRRYLYCPSACSFVQGANVTILGCTGTNTVTMAAGSWVEVFALTATTFRLRYWGAGSFTSSTTGFSVDPTPLVRFNIANSMVQLNIAYVAPATPSGTAITIAGFPPCCNPSTTQTMGPILVCDQTTWLPGCVVSMSTGGTLTLYKDATLLAAWVAAGTRGIWTLNLQYPLG